MNYIKYVTFIQHFFHSAVSSTISTSASVMKTVKVLQPPRLYVSIIEEVIIVESHSWDFGPDNDTVGHIMKRNKLKQMYESK